MELSLLLSLCGAIANRSSECTESPGATCTRRYTPVWMRVITLLACVSQCGCFGLGTTRFYQDQLGYSRAVGDAEKSNTLLNTVRLRYGDTPVVLQPTQVISGYQLQRNVSGGFEVFPAANPSTFLNGSASAQLQQTPTLGGDRLLKPRRAALAFPEHPKRAAEVVLRPCPLERRALARPFLQRVAEGRDRLLEPRRTAL